MDYLTNDNGPGSERILISIALFMFAIVVGYNAFYTGSPAEIIGSPANIAADEQEYSFDQEETRQNFKVNLNTASESELTFLEGIGAAKAKNIIEYRETHGGFASIKEVMNVKGIGKKAFEKIKDNICI